MKGIEKRIRLHLIVTLGIMLIIGGLLGCGGPGQNLRPVNEYGDPSPQRLTNLQEDRIPPDSYDSATGKKRSEMTSGELEKSGDALLAKRNLAMAFVQYEKSLSLNSENPRVHYKKGLTLVLGGINEDAVKTFQETLKIDPEYALAYEGLGRAFFHMRKYDEAERNFRKAIELDPKLWKPHNFLGIICSHQERYGAAIREYASAIILEPDEGLLYNNLGLSYYMTGEYEKAVNAFNKALEVKYFNNKFYNNLGLALCKLGRYKEALGAFREGGDPARAYNNLGCVYLRQGEFEKAVDCFEKAIGISPSFYVKASENLRKAKMGYNALQ